MVMTVESPTHQVGLLPEVGGSSDNGSFCSSGGCGIHYQMCRFPKGDMVYVQSPEEATHAFVSCDEGVTGLAVQWYRLLWRLNPTELQSDDLVFCKVSGFLTINKQKTMSDDRLAVLIALEDQPEDGASET